MERMILTLSCFAILASANAGHLIGKNTPVWVARRASTDQPVTYSMLDREIVKKTIDDWIARNDRKGLHNTQIETSSSGLMHIVTKTPKEFDKVQADILKFRARNNKQTPPPPPPAARDVNVLVAMDYPSSWPIRREDEQTYIQGKILYAVTFCNAIHQRLKRSYGPKYNIRIAGMIIGSSKEATPYLRQHEKDGILNPSNAAIEMNTYFENIGNTDFPLDGRQLLFTMTESKTAEGSQGWAVAEHNGHHGMVYSDRLLTKGFAGLNRETLGSSLARWSNASFKNYPHLSSGEGISDVPLPGQIISLNKQCAAFGYGADNVACLIGEPKPDWVKLKCRKSSNAICKVAAEQALDGSYCADKAIAIDGLCNSISTVTY